MGGETSHPVDTGGSESNMPLLLEHERLGDHTGQVHGLRAWGRFLCRTQRKLLDTVERFPSSVIFSLETGPVTSPP